MASEDHLYFQQLEESFLQLRGAPLVLSPADWKLAREWRGLGIPTPLVIGVFKEMFERHAERGDGRRVNGFRYCAAAVRKAWSEQIELLGASAPVAEAAPDRETAQEDPREMLEALVRRLPKEWHGSDDIRSKVLGLTGDVSDVESSLGEVDSMMLDLAWRTLDATSKDAVEKDLAERAAGMARGGAGLKTRLRNQVLRKHLGLPRLSLFSFLT